MTLLIFVGGLIVPFRFVSTVTVLQHRVAIGPSRAGPQGGPSREAPTGIAGYRLPKTWASAGAFSVLTPNSKLAPYEGQIPAIPDQRMLDPPSSGPRHAEAP